MECVRDITYIFRIKLKVNSQGSKYHIINCQKRNSTIKGQNNKAHKEILQDHLKYKDYKLITYFTRCCGCNVPLSAQNLQQNTLML